MRMWNTWSLRSLALSHSLPPASLPSCHRRSKQRKQSQKSKNFWSEFRSGSSGYEVCFQQKPPYPTPKCSSASILSTPGAVIIFPSSSCQHLFTPPPTPILSSPFPLRPRVALLHSVCFLQPSLPFCSCLPLLLTHSALPQALCFHSSATDERTPKWRSAC